MDQPVVTTVSNTAFIATLSRFCRLSASYHRDDDRRARCRFQVEDGAVAATVRSPDRVIQGTLVNISSAGALVRVEEEVPDETAIDLILTVGDQSYRHAGVVVQSITEHGRVLLSTAFDSERFERIASGASLPN